MYVIIASAAVGLLAALSVIVWRRQRRQRLDQRAFYIQQYALPTGLWAKLQQKHPQLTPQDFEQVTLGLRHFFLVYLQSGFRSIAMPSQVVDDLWHEFILYTQVYQQFCQAAFGRFLHHTPAEELGRRVQSSEALRQVWQQACVIEGINPRKATQLPLLFALDRQLAIIGGFIYLVDCTAARKASLLQPGINGAPAGGYIHCGGDFYNPAFFSHSAHESSGCAGSAGCVVPGSGCTGGHGGA